MIAKVVNLIRAAYLAVALWWLRLKIWINRSVKRVLGFNLKLIEFPSVLKVPKHLGLHIELDPMSESHDTEKSLKSVASLILWGFDTGTENITIFEPSGFLSDPANLNFIMKYLKAGHSECSCIGLFQKLKEVKQISINDSQNLLLQNDISSKKRVKLQFLSHKDGHDDLSRLIKEIAADDSYAVKDINDELLARELSSNVHDIPMDCILGVSNCEIIPSFPPWLLRNAEIFFLGSLMDVSYEAFFREIVKFSRTQQRWGR
mmetsp:Transcript_3464/g.4361  ORF Transcript_3464/g.4361 Transcript_3464/m.4361 type:complete len:261 (+) Transcript_3464:18-800(+)